MSRIIKLKESDLVNIVKNIISEQTTPSQSPFKLPNGGTVKIKNLYAAGYYSMVHTDKAGNTFDNTKQLKPVINQAYEFLNANKGSFIPKIIIRAGESIIPNTDVEGGTGKMEKGTLAEKRQQKITEYVIKQFKPLVDNKTISKLPEIIYFFTEGTQEIPPLCTKDDFGPYAKWVRSTQEQKDLNPNNKEYARLQKIYNNDQKTEIEFSIIPDLGPNQCSFNVQIGVHYDDKTIKHFCNYAKYEITANGVVLTTIGGTTAGANKPYADMNNGGGISDSQGNKDYGGKRYNFFKLNNKKLIENILSKSPDGNTIVLRAKCLSPGYDGGSGCHKDAPHVTVHDSDGQLTINTYPNIDDGELITMDKCGKKLISGGGSKPTQSKDTPNTGENAGQKTTKPTLTGKKLNFSAPSTGTLTSQQSIQNQISNGNVQKEPNGTYLVLKPFTYNNVLYKPGDIIVKVI